MSKYFEVKLQDATLISFKARDNIRIDDVTLNALFNFLIENSQGVFFIGIKQEFFNKELLGLLKFIAVHELNDNADTSRIIFEVKPSSIQINRGLLSQVWSYYEYPALVFLCNDKYKIQLEELFLRKATYQEISETIGDVYILYKSFEENVLWLSTGNEMTSITDCLQID